jgi:hypothetical protein
MIDFAFASDREPHPLQAALSLALAAPRRLEDRSDLALHMDRAMVGVEDHLQWLDHVQPATGREFDLAAYYADDLDTQAWCAAHDGRFLACIGMGFVCRLVKICDRIGAAILPLALKADGGFSRPAPAAFDGELAALIRGDIDVSRAEAQAIASAWPAPHAWGLQCGFGGWALFYDLLRLVWLHEMAHALCGHVAVVQDRLGLAGLQEFAAEREAAVRVQDLDLPRHLVLQAFETHADEFAAAYCIEQLLFVKDPPSAIAGPRVDLASRLVVFNLACCVFAVMWAYAERAGRPVDSSHPPADFRYLRFRTTHQRLLDEFHAQEPQAAGLRLKVDAHSFGLLEALESLDPRFGDLRVITPVVAQTPQMQRLADYEDLMLDIGELLAPWLREAGFLPRALQEQALRKDAQDDRPLG